MSSSLDRARNLVEHLRFAGDMRHGGDHELPAADRLLAYADQNAMRITPRLLPMLASAWASACESLAVPPGAAVAYVVQESTPHAEVYPDDRERCVVRFSSGLVNLLDAEEFKFVAGHELGHFLLGHLSGRAAGVQRSIEEFMLARAAEISVDRVGLRACGSIESSVRAIMKLLAGLNAEHLRFDVGDLLRQLDGLEDQLDLGESEASHPSLVVRARALLWFGMTGVHSSPEARMSEADRATLDARVQADLVKYVDGPARALIRQASDDVAMWTAAASLVASGTYSRPDQQAFAAAFGAEVEGKFRRMAGELSMRDLSSWVETQLAASKARLFTLIPRGYEQEMARIRERLLPPRREGSGEAPSQ